MSLAKGTAVLRTALLYILSGFLAELTAVTTRTGNCGARMEVKPKPVNQWDTVTLTCSTTCSLSTNPSYIWYHNTQPIINKHTVTDNTLTINSMTVEYSGRYSCAVRGHEDRPSPAECVWKCFGVAYNPESMCALEGSTVDLHSYYSYPDDYTITSTFWFIDGNMGYNLSTNGRVTYTGNSSSHTLSIRNLTIGDANNYRFRFITKEAGGWSGVNVPISVTGLQVQNNSVGVNVNEGDTVTLTCSTNCSLSNNPTYIWYKNSQPVDNKYTATGNTLTIQAIQNEDSGRYSCAVRGHEDLPSKAVCVWKCWGVAYNPESVCALEGSSAELHSYYSYPDGLTVTETFWFIRSPEGVPENLMKDVDYTGRVNYIGNTKYIHTLRITNLRLSDTNNYRFRFITSDASGKYSGVNVPFSVTGLQVLVDPVEVNEGSTVALTCSTTCSLSTNPTYIWYQNSQPVIDKHSATGNTLIINAATPEDAGGYSCAVEGHQSLESTLNVRYVPRNTLASVDPSGDPKEGDSVNLRCSSDANPTPQFTWYKKTGGQSSAVSSRQIYKMEDIRSEQSGLYYCEAQNEMGKDKSVEIQINVEYPPRNFTVSVSPPGDIKEGDSVTLTCSSDANPPVENYTWYKKPGTTPSSSWLHGEASYNITNITAEDSGHYYCTAENKYGAQNSSTTHLDVLYSPRNTSVSVSPPGDIKEGDSVTLTCSSDANPPVENYTWYRSAGDDTVIRGTKRMSNFTFTLVTGLEGHYHCEAGNKLGKHNSTTVQLILQGSGFYKILFPGVGAIFAIGLLLLCILFWRRQKSNAPTTPQGTDSRQQSGPTHGVNDNDKGDDDDADDVQYATVHFKAKNKKQDQARDTVQVSCLEEEKEEGSVEYATVHFKKRTDSKQGLPGGDYAVPEPQEETLYATVKHKRLSTAPQEGGECIYSQINKKPRP